MSISFAGNTNAGFSDNIDRTAPNFVKALLLVMVPSAASQKGAAA